MAQRGSPPSRTPPCRFPAVGSLGATPRPRPGMCDPRSQQRVLTQDFSKPFPRQRLSPCRAAQPFPPDATDSLMELPNSEVVRASSVVLVMAAELGVQGFLLLVNRIVPVSSDKATWGLFKSFSFSICGATNDEHPQARARRDRLGRRQSQAR
jgi:hypothetical protein